MMKIVQNVVLKGLEIARDVLQKQIDERVALRRQEMLLADSFIVSIVSEIFRVPTLRAGAVLAR